LENKYKEKFKKISRKVLEFIGKKPTESHNYKQISKGISLKTKQEKGEVIKSLNVLLSERKIKKTNKGKYKLKTKNLEINETITGIIDFNHSGNAYVSVKGIDEDIFVHVKNVKNALQGDTVIIVPFKFKGKKLEGAVVDVLERNRVKFVGTFQYVKTKDIGFVIFDKKMMNTDIFVSKSNFGGAKEGDKVVVKMLKWDEKSKNPEGKIVKVLGKPGEHETEIHSIIAEYGLPYSFPYEVENEANSINKNLSKSEISKRLDMRDVLTFTIDPKDAKDFDDAISIQKLKNGNYQVGIHIADVSYYVRPNTKLDEEAYKRATSVYLVDRVVPMLPEVLSNELCSLRQNEDKFTFSVVLELNDNAEIKNQWIGRTVINSNKRFTYEEAQESIEKGLGDFAQEIKTLNSFAKILRENRMKDGAIAFDRSEVKFNLDSENQPISVYFKISKDANHLVEEFMLLANKKVSEFVSLNKSRKPTKNTFVYRIHDDPDPTKLSSLRDFATTLGYKMDISSRKNISESLNKLLYDVKGKGEENMIETLAMRSMSKAVYSTENIGHYGLAFDYYSHFTSPIRRYPDILAHRLLQHYIDGGKSPNSDEYEEYCKHCSDMERRASDAERESIKFMQVKFMESHVGDIFKGVISGVTEWGIYVEIPENGSEGLIRLRDLTDDSYFYDLGSYSIQGTRNGKVYRLGDEVKIKVLKANIIAKQLDFKLI